MTYRILYTRTARRGLSGLLPEAAAAACVEFIRSVLATTPHRAGQPLRPPLEGLHSARRGDFRVIYRIDDDEVVVLVITVQHRRDVYRT
ncbi:MAG TPA: type II toxin-antitoxin system RelE/ParE family toxin [Nocardioides sp.]|uniref:type II toxin-antitoxin system RelE family toxin n=1 Tax=Nocardioides sp. TaxID=35761 RepID=UPI002E329284|nr:type II toxin-antitoxin system RelE/ParE family toxin [Nocardioides sp.]HEX5087125.1 type II toxin-antitoxin system RelE/ParE family toxin [Nocardioides sp.]